MSKEMHPLLQVSPAVRMDKTIDIIKQQEAVWILKDADGCVMLSTDDEDGVPVWPDSDMAALWATEEWSDCEPMEISLADWLKKWTPGLMGDGLTIMVSPVPGEEGEIIMPDEFAEKLL